MQVLNTKGDDISPDIKLDHLENIFSITGESRPENPLKYYQPVFAWFNKHLKIDLDYFNSTSAKVLFDLFMLLNNTGLKKFKINFEIDWYYHAEDMDMLDAGKEMERMCGVTFNYIEK